MINTVPGKKFNPIPHLLFFQFELFLLFLMTIKVIITNFSPSSDLDCRKKFTFLFSSYKKTLVFFFLKRIFSIYSPCKPRCHRTPSPSHYFSFSLLPQR